MDNITLDNNEIYMMQIALLSMENQHNKLAKEAAESGHPIISKRNTKRANEYSMLLSKVCDLLREDEHNGL